MDEKDFLILGHLFQQPLASFEAIGRQSGLTRNAVARRVRDMQASALRLRWAATPHPSLFGRRAFLNLFGPHDHVDGDRILAVPDVVGFDHNYDGLVPVTSYVAQREPHADLVAMLGEPIASYDTSGPGPRVPHLSRLEWKVLTACVREPRASLAALARASGLGAKTVGRHRARLVEQGALEFSAFVQEGAADIPIFRAYLQGSPDPAAIEDVVPGSIRLAVTREPAGEVRFCRAATPSAVMSAVQRLGRVPGVEDLKVILTQRIEWINERLVRWCEEARDRAGGPVDAV